MSGPVPRRGALRVSPAVGVCHSFCRVKPELGSLLSPPGGGSARLCPPFKSLYFPSFRAGFAVRSLTSPVIAVAEAAPRRQR